MNVDLSPALNRDAYQFHHALNPRIWRKMEMRSEVRLHLLRSAMAFFRFLGVDGLIIKDIVLTGSNAGYNYTHLSDLDVHLIVDFLQSTCPDLEENLFLTKKALWSATHSVTIRGHIVEFYVEDSDAPALSNGLYSILAGRWLREPSPVPPTHDDSAVEQKVSALADEIDAALEASPDESRIGALIQRLYGMRQNGLLVGGEFSTENLAFKALRSLGYMDRLLAARRGITDTKLSLN